MKRVDTQLALVSQKAHETLRRQDVPARRSSSGCDSSPGTQGTASPLGHALGRTRRLSDEAGCVDFKSVSDVRWALGAEMTARVLKNPARLASARETTAVMKGGGRRLNCPLPPPNCCFRGRGFAG
eukprot:5039440-Pleurochrysis_carterae.AAC.1